jgi:hypothetical protein
MFVMFNRRKHRPVQTFKLDEAQDDSHLRRTRQNIFLWHTEDSVQDIDFDIWSQRCKSFKMLLQFFFAAPGHVGDKQFAPLLMFSLSCFISTSSLLTIRRIIWRPLTTRPCPVRFTVIPPIQYRLFINALIFR